ncbi:universal stress protein [Rhodopseudomonas palustris]|uniref:UspA domain protein n=1 Tax=Rhodopseudomonas palustris (strain DX-1) TaxID=652103 RepID=E6VEH0_RHOPX|nr:universal stress protein [Rhodopseudomonas palustris]QDL97711.1 universal stress protein [Rhodopseudomonas palustris]
MSMLKRTLILLGQTESSVSARDYAFRLAQRTGTDLAGLAGLDLRSIETPMLGGIGTSAYKAQLEQELKSQAEATRQRLHEEFERECRERALPFEWLSFEGDPIEAFQLATETRDLVVAGHDTGYGGDLTEPLSEILAKLLLRSPRPLIVCPDRLPEGEAILVAYDGSVPAMRALQMFVLLGLGTGQRIVVAAVDRSEEAAARNCAAAASYLRSHGYESDACPITSSVDPSEAIRLTVADRRVGTLVMGAYGRRGFREALFGSTTDALVETPPCALFLYH